MSDFPRVVIDLAALTHNLRTLKALAPECRVMAVVKANAYGHGLVAVARTLADAGVDALAVARVGEALALREAGILAEIVLLEGVFSGAELQLAADQQLTLVVHCEPQLAMLEAASGTARFRCWLKLDTGMHRLGFLAAEAGAAMRRIAACGAVQDPPGLMTHLSAAEDASDPATGQQLAAFEALSKGWPGEVSIANSAAVLMRPQTRTGWIRPGLALYGASPMAAQTGADFGLAPAMTLETRVIAVKTVPKGGRVGYNGAWTARRPTRIGIVAAGYGDGYLRSIGNGAPVLVDGRPAQVIGRVSMDMIAVAIADGDEARDGARVVLWGPDLPVERIAARADTIPYELLCNVSARVAAEYLPQPERMA